LNLLFVNSTRRWGGVKSWTLRAAAGLQARGHQVWVAGRMGDPFLDACRDADLTVLPVAFGMSWSPLRIMEFHRFLRRNHVDLVVGNTGRDLSTAGVAARWAGIPLVHRVGSGSDFRDTSVRRRAHQWLRPRLLAPAQVVKDELLERFSWLGREDVEVSWNAAQPVRLPATGSLDRLVCMSRLAQGKGLEDLLRALALLKSEGIVMQADLVGSGPLEASLGDLVRGLGLEEQVRFPGFLRPASGVLSLAGMGVLPSHAEGFPNTLLEYWAAGLAVVASDLPGVREALGTSRAARLVPPGDPPALAAALGALLKDPESARGMATEGRARAEREFHPHRESERLERLFQDLVDRPPAR
jgi:glycosyltransferase involved in cell wall biosynthesis